MFLVYFVVVPLVVITSFGTTSWKISGQAYETLTDVPPVEKLMTGLAVAIFLLVAITFYRLLILYEKGIIFTHQNARLFRILGYLAFGNGLVGVVAPVASSGLLSITGMIFGTLASPWVIGGLFGVMISHIMDKGCKMREEQELTV